MYIRWFLTLAWAWGLGVSVFSRISKNFTETETSSFLGNCQSGYSDCQSAKFYSFSSLMSNSSSSNAWMQCVSDALVIYWLFQIQRILSKTIVSSERFVYIRRVITHQELGVELLEWFKKNDIHEKCLVSKCFNVYSHFLSLFRSAYPYERNRGYLFLQNRRLSLFCTRAAKMLEELQLKAITQFPGYLQNVLGERIRTIDTDTSFVLQTIFCLDFIMWFHYKACAVFSAASTAGSTSRISVNCKLRFFENCVFLQSLVVTMDVKIREMWWHHDYLLPLRSGMTFTPEARDTIQIRTSSISVASWEKSDPGTTSQSRVGYLLSLIYERRGNLLRKRSHLNLLPYWNVCGAYYNFFTVGTWRSWLLCDARKAACVFTLEQSETWLQDHRTFWIPSDDRASRKRLWHRHKGIVVLIINNNKRTEKLSWVYSRHCERYQYSLMENLSSAA